METSKLKALLEHKAASASLSMQSIAERYGKDYIDKGDYKYMQGKWDMALELLSDIEFGK